VNAAASGFVATTAPGTDWAVDVNPSADRIRLIGSNGTNLRLHPDTGAIGVVDSAPVFVAGDTNTGPASVSSAGYTNNFGGGAALANGAKATTLFALDATNDALVAIDDPNLGVTRTVGALGVAVSGGVELDITTNGLAYAVVNIGGVEKIHGVNLATGALSAAGTITPAGTITGFAIENGASPAISDSDGYAVTESGVLTTFELATPSAATVVAPVTGLAAGFTIEGIDTRPLDGGLFGIAVNQAADKAQLVRLSRTTAAATPIGIPIAVAATASTEFGFDFNPTVDRIRFVTSAGTNLRINPSDGVPTTDGAVSYIAGDPAAVAPSLTSTAYSNTFAGAAGTIHYGIDVANSSVVRFTNSNLGQIKTARALSSTVTGDTGLDVHTDGRAFVTINSSGTKLFTLNVVTGVLTPANVTNAAVGSGEAIKAFAISGNYVPRTPTDMAALAPLKHPITGGFTIRFDRVIARLTTNTGAGVPGAPIVFFAGSAFLCSTTTDVDGTARCAVNLERSLRILLNGGYTAAFAGDDVYLPASDRTSLTG
jgi:hypothetical protein